MSALFKAMETSISPPQAIELNEDTGYHAW